MQITAFLDCFYRHFTDTHSFLVVLYLEQHFNISLAICSPSVLESPHPTSKNDGCMTVPYQLVHGLISESYLGIRLRTQDHYSKLRK